MSEEFELSPANQELEKALGGLKPAATHLDRDRLMFRAGQFSARRQPVFWPALSGALAILLAISWSIQVPPNSRTPEKSGTLEVQFDARKIRPAERPSASNPWVASHGESAPGINFKMNGYLELLDGVLRRGLDGLPRERSGNHSGAVESWRPYTSTTADNTDTQM